MNVKGQVVSILPVQSGEGKNGAWVKNTYIIETGGQYPKKVAVSVWGDTLPTLKVGRDVDCAVELESREFNSKWYTEVKAWKIDFVSGSSAPAKEKSSTEKRVSPDNFETPVGADTLPF